MLKFRIILIYEEVLKIRIRDRNLTFFISLLLYQIHILYCCLLTEGEPGTVRLYLAVNKFALDEWVKHELKVHPPKNSNYRAIKHRFSVDERRKV